MEFPPPPNARPLYASRPDAGRPDERPSAAMRQWALLRTGIWSVCYFAFYLAQQLAELLAPLVFVLGIGWAALPYIVRAVTTSAANADPQARDVMTHVAGAIPSQLLVGTHLLTPTGLIVDGFLLMGLAAAGATLSALSARNM